MLPLLAVAVLGAQATGTSVHRSDTEPLVDSGRTVSRISRDGFTIQYATSEPCPTRVEVRQGDRLAVLEHTLAPSYRVLSRPGADSRWHRVAVAGLQPGRRYFYRLYDPGAAPTSVDAEWGAAAPWSREYAVSTQAPAGRKTIIHIPVKVLLMPNVVNAQSAQQPDGSIAPDPPKITPAQITLIENEFLLASRVFWCNSGMRLWVDFKFCVDDRWQRWGPPADNSSPFFQDLPVCRSYGGQDYVEPGGGIFSFVDTRHPHRASSAPVADGYACQVEMAWPRRWDPTSKTWNFYTSGGGTLGVDDLPKGIPARTQFLAGGDTAWLVEHEFHHQLESLGQFSLGDSEDDRIVFDHPSPRHRYRRGDGSFDEQDWTTTGRHGDQWDVMRYWDRRITDCQWLRLAFGTTETVADQDGDSFPDRDPDLPLDARRFSAFTRSYAKGVAATYAAACAYDWVGVPLQSSWLKDRSNRPSPAPTSTWIVPAHLALDGNVNGWRGIDPLGRITGPIALTYYQAYDEQGYYGLITAKGDVGHIDVDLDGDGRGMFTPPAALGFSIDSLQPAPGQAGPVVLPVEVRPTFGGVRGLAPWLMWQAARRRDGVLVFEFKIANGGDSPWYWHGAGHRIGVGLNVYGADGRGYSLGEPYRLTYCRMEEGRGMAPTPAAPDPLPTRLVTVEPGPKGIALTPGWTLTSGGTYHHEGPAAAITLPGRKAVDFDLAVEVDGVGSFGIGALAPLTPRPDLNRDYAALIDGGVATARANGVASDGVRIAPGLHRVELRRRGGGIWVLIDGNVAAYELDKSPRTMLNRFTVFAEDGAVVSIRRIEYRESRNS